MKFLPALAVGMLLASGCAVADCTNPAGDAGHVIFNTTVKAMQYCDGTSWINAGAVIPNAPQTGCTSPSGVAGQIIYANNLGVVQFCNGSSWVDTACAAERKPSGSGCTNPAGAAGTIQYASHHNELQFCDSTDWVAMGWACADPERPVEVVAYVSATTSDLVLSSLFSSQDWADDAKRKRVVINSGVTIGSTSATVSAVSTGTGRGRDLIIENHGTIAGAGGAANGGAGGDAINVQQGSVTVLNTGNIYGGGGGGGAGGTGGNGTYTTTVTQGPYYVAGYGWNDSKAFGNGALETRIEWAGSYVYNGARLGASRVIGIYTYYRGAQRDYSSYLPKYEVRRTYSANNATVGGAGGNGGRGQGSDGSSAVGSAGVAGETNAGTGGAGGAGGGWGTAGASGTVGNAGNNGAGAASAAGGPAGAAITGSGYTLTNSGTVIGTY